MFNPGTMVAKGMGELVGEENSNNRTEQTINLGSSLVEATNVSIIVFYCGLQD